MSHTPSPQQAAAYEWVQYGSGSAIVESVAGSGKTTVLMEIAKLIAAMPRQSGVFTAYNKSIANEIESRLKDAGIGWKQVRSATFHSLGYGAWRKVAPDVQMVEDKIGQIMEERAVPAEYRGFVAAIVSLAKAAVIGVERPIEDLGAWFDIVAHYDLEDKLENAESADAVTEGIKLAQGVLRSSIERNRVAVDFDDMLYAPLVHDVRMWQYDWVLVDEAQDTNAARRALARKMLKPGGRLVAVGDPHQAIYGFTGADNDSLDLIAQEFGAIRLPLTVTYRCPKMVVNHARQWVSHITAHETAPNGAVLHMADAEFQALPEAAFDKESAILCRNTKPLVEMAFHLIRRRIPCHVEGRDIGKGLVKLARKWKSISTVAQLAVRLDDHLEQQTERLLAKKQEAKLQVLADQVETLRVFIDSMALDASLDDLETEIMKVFADHPAPGITLSTIHKAKGREWNRVYWYGRNRWQPSPYARQQWQQEQERNLMYVAATRAKQTLVEVEVPFPPK